MNVIIWARVSSKEQRDGFSLDAQLRATRDKAAREGWRVVREFVVAESAKKGAERAIFNQMFKWVQGNARREKINAILSHKLDRACRNIRDAVRLQELEDSCGVKLCFVDNQFGPGAAGQLSFNVMAAVAQYYSDNLRTEVLKGMEERIQQGWPLGSAPFGYFNDQDDDDEPVKPHPEKSEAVVRIFDLFSTGAYTFKTLAIKLEQEGHTLRPSQPRFHRSALSYILNNRFYIGEMVRGGKTYRGKYRMLIDRQVFEMCHDILAGKNRRTGKPHIPYSGGLFRCAYCGRAMTGEKIRRKLLDGRVNEHIYYKCLGNGTDGHPNVRWRQNDLDEQVQKELETFRMPSEEVAQWFRDSVKAAFADSTASHATRNKMLAKRQTELKQMQDRLLTAFLNGVVAEATFKEKSEQLKVEQDRHALVMQDAGQIDAKRSELAIRTFDLSQIAAAKWRGSSFSERCRILIRVSSNRVLSDVSLKVEKRSPFDILVERRFLKDTTPSLQHLKPDATAVQAFIQVFLQPLPPYLDDLAGLEDGDRQDAGESAGPA